MRPWLILAVFLAGPIDPAVRQVGACPGCGPIGATITEDIATMDVAVIARLVKFPPPAKPGDDELKKATFEVSQILKGDGLIRKGDKLDALYISATTRRAIRSWSWGSSRRS